MRTVSPGFNVPSNGLPAADLPINRRLAGTVAMSAACTA